MTYIIESLQQNLLRQVSNTVDGDMSRHAQRHEVTKAEDMHVIKQ